jgi:hypothetical protein
VFDLEPVDEEFDSGLLAWLTSLDEDQLAQVLANRADSVDPPWPRRFVDLVYRLSDDVSVVLALRTMPAPGHQVLRAVQLCHALADSAEPVPGRVVADWLNTSVSEVAAVLDDLARRALGWTDRAGRIVLPTALDVEGYAAYGLGEPISVLLAGSTTDQLKDVAVALGIGARGRKHQLVDQLTDFFRDGAKVRALVAGAPPKVTELLHEFTRDGPDGPIDLGSSHYGQPPGPDSPGIWSVRRGLLWPIGYSEAHLPLEVGLALRGQHYRLPFAPTPPALVTGPVSAEQVTAESSAAALRLLDRTLTLVGSTVSNPLPLLKSSGRVGAKAIKSRAKEIGAATDEVRLVVELASRAGLLSIVEPEPDEPPARRTARKPQPKPAAGSLAATERFATWRAEDSTTRLHTLLQAWWSLPLSPLGDEQLVKDVLGREPSSVFVHVRHLVVRLLTELPEGAGATGADLAELVGWNAPMINADLLGALVESSMAEATLLGVVAAGAAGELARALVASTPDLSALLGLDGQLELDNPDLTWAIKKLMAGARTTALFGADLTAVVTGPPDVELAALLDRVADREAQGAASTWRFSPASVRRALDGGDTVADLLDRLGTAAQQDLPQPLVYLINDAGRRHGEVGVVAAGCVLVGEVPALLTELAAHRRLAALGLRQVAPTVLLATAGVAATLTALREAGYAPVQRTSDGAPVLRVTPTQPARQPQTTMPEAAVATPTAPPPDPHEHARRLREVGHSMAKRVPVDQLTAWLPHGGRQTTDPLLVWQLRRGAPVRVEYVQPGEERRELVISDAELVDDGTIDAWVEPAGRYERLALSGILPGPR